MAFSSRHRTLISLIIALLSTGLTIAPVESLNFSFPSFTDKERTFLLSTNSNILNDAIQVTQDLSDIRAVMNISGRALYHKALRIWRKDKDNNKAILTSFESTFVLNISPDPRNQFPVGEGLAFVLVANPSLPSGSQGQWLGIADNSSSSTDPRIVAVEFDTRKSFPEDLDDNHVGLDLNSTVYSVSQVSLTGHGINISHGDDLRVRITYDARNISVFVSLLNGADSGIPVLTRALDLSDYLPERVYVGFSASTGAETFQRNCVKSWAFGSSDIDPSPSLLWVFIAVPIATIFLFAAAFFVYRTNRRCCREDLEEAYQSAVDEIIRGSSTAPKKFRLRELRKATDNFNPKNQLGQGGFGTVYKGSIGGSEVAVKRVKKNSKHGKQEFVSEVTTIASLSHKNLVKLIGWCYERTELLIVYEFMPNGSLDRFIFRDDEKKPELSWDTRQGIVLGVAQALDYLHNGSENRVLHRDVKASNVMLDSEFNARLGDFGLARAVRRSEGRTHHSTREIAGTPGYMAPESFLTGWATVETDVYAFGVLLLEVVTGKKPAGNNAGGGGDGGFGNGLVKWAWGAYGAGRKEFWGEEMGCVVGLGLACCHPNPGERPSMRTILKVLEGEEGPPALPKEMPAFVWPALPPSFKFDGDTTLRGGTLTPFTEITGR